MNKTRRRAAVLVSSLVIGFGLPTSPAGAKSANPKPSTSKPAAAKPSSAKPAAKKPSPTKPSPIKPSHTKPAAKKPSPTKTAVKPASAPVGIVKSATAPTLAIRMAAVKTAKTLNYYPTTAAWSAMWTSWNVNQIDADLAKAQVLGATNVRAILFPQTFGYPTPRADYMAKLDKFISLAASHGMTVKFTMFDWWDGYRDISGSSAWANAVLRPYKDDSRVIAVELKNEFDPGESLGITWAKKIIPAVRAVAPQMPLTFSVNGVIGSVGMGKIKAALVSAPLDYYDFHFYGNSERALANIKRAQAAVSPTPVVIGEVGLNTLQNTEGEQAAFLARVFEGAKIAGVQSVAPWTLNDFIAGAIPTSDVSKLPAQYSYGLYRTDGTAKPAAAVVKAEWGGTALPTNLLDNSFEATAGQGSWRPYLPELGFPVKTSKQAHTGSWSISFTKTGKSSSGVPSYRVAPIPAVQVAQKWHGEVWARGTGATGTSQIALSWFDINDNWLGGVASSALPTGTTSWTKLSVDGFAPPGSASMQVHLKSGGNSGTVWFDDVAVSSS